MSYQFIKMTMYPMRKILRKKLGKKERFSVRLNFSSRYHDSDSESYSPRSHLPVPKKNKIKCNRCSKLFKFHVRMFCKKKISCAHATEALYSTRSLDRLTCYSWFSLFIIWFLFILRVPCIPCIKIIFHSIHEIIRKRSVHWFSSLNFLIPVYGCVCLFSFHTKNSIFTCKFYRFSFPSTVGSMIHW